MLGSLDRVETPSSPQTGDMMAAEAEPEAESYLQWPAPSTPFVLCNRKLEDGTYVHGDDAAGRVQRASYRPHCVDCNKETVALAAAGDAFAPQSIAELLAARRRTESTVPIRSCFNPECGGASKRAWVDLRCCGDAAAGNGCRARASEGDCALLPQALPAADGDVDNVLFVDLDPGEPMLKFDPCGHTLSVESFVGGVEQAFGGGSARHEIKPSPSLGTFCLTCPVREPGLPCENSFVHDVHHYKLAGAAAYGRIKTYGLEASGFGGGGGGGGGAAGGAAGGGAAMPAEGVPPTSVAGLIAQIVDAITDAQVVRCPYDGTVFEKDGACTHIDTCPGRLPDGSKHPRICYYCGKKWCDVDPPANKEHKTDWQTNPKRCIWFLESQHPLFRTGDGFAALQDFHKWRLTRLLHERIYTKVASGLWEQAMASQPELLQGLYANDAHPEGVAILTSEVRDYGQRAQRSEELDCWVGTMADFTGRMP